MFLLTDVIGVFFQRSFGVEKEIGGDELGGTVEEHRLPEFLELHQTVVRKIGEVSRIVNQVAICYYLVIICRPGQPTLVLNLPRSNL